MKHLALILFLTVGLSTACDDDDMDSALKVYPGEVQHEESFSPGDSNNETITGWEDGAATGTDSGKPAGEDNGKPIFDPPGKPQLLMLTVTQGPASGGTATTLISVGFAADFREALPEVSLGQSKVTKMEALSRGILQLETPPGDAGKVVDVIVKTANESAALSSVFLYYDKAPKDYVLLTLNGKLNPPGTPTTMELKVKSFGTAKPAALLAHIKVDLLQLPLASPTTLPGDVHVPSGKEFSVNDKKNDIVSVLLLGKNRNPIKDGVVARFFYSVPPVDPWLITPLTLTAEVVDGLGKPIPFVVQSGWVGVAGGADD
jgi:hypothetical protein